MRKTKYDTHVAPFLYEIGQMARNGATEEEIAKKLNVAYSTFREYKGSHEELKEALRPNKEMADLKVEASLYNKALGFKTTVRKAFKVKESYYDDRGKKVEKEKIVTAEEDQYVPPDTLAIMFYLKNRKPDTWRDKQHVEVNGLKEEQSKLAELLEQRKERRESKC